MTAGNDRRLQVALLGELEVRLDGRVIAVGGVRQQALLARLTLETGRPVSSQRLLEEVWGGETTPKPLQMAVARCRRALEHEAWRLQTRALGYVLELDDGALDLARFERALRDAEAAAREGDWTRARDRAALALEAWRGPALSGLTEYAWAALEADRLEDQRLHAHELRFAAELEQGAGGTLVAELSALTTARPDRERLCAQLMLALYRDGRQREALEAFQRARRHLDEEYGIVPGQGLREMAEAILRQDAVLLAPNSGLFGGGASTPAGAAGGRVAGEDEATAADGTEPLPLPRRLADPGHARLVGREQELHALAVLLARDPTEDRAAVVITGEAGIGKTRLIGECARRAHESRRATVIAGRCDEDLGIPYQPFAEALDHLVAHVPAELLRAHRAAHGQGLDRLVPSAAQRLGEVSAASGAAGEFEQYSLFAAVEALLAAAATERPLLIVLEDLHWADEPTVRMLRYLLTSPRRATLVLALTVRDTEVAADSPLGRLLADLHREPHVTRMELAGLDPEAVRALVDDVGGSELAGQDELAERLHRSTAGNPFFVTELARHLAEGGGDAAAIDAARLPVSVSETLERRVARLGSRARSCMSIAAAIGHEFDEQLLEDAADVDPLELGSAMRAALDAGLVLRTPGSADGLGFAHALTGRWLYDQLSSAERSGVHLRIARALERRATQQPVRAAELARHWLAAAPRTEPLTVVGYCRQAGDEALHRLAPGEAARWYERAIQLLPDTADANRHERCELLIRRGTAEQQAGDPAFRDTLLGAARLARAVDDADALVRATLANTRGLQSATGATDAERIEALDAALLAVGPADTIERALLLATQAVELTFSGEWERRGQLSDEALAVARRLGHPETSAQVLNLRFLTIWAPQTLGERLANTAEAVAVTTNMDATHARFYAHHWRAAACIEAADAEEARRCVAIEHGIAEALRQPTLVWLADCHRADIAQIDGRLDEAEAFALQAFQIGIGEPDAMACYAAQLTSIHHDRSGLGALVAMLESVRADNEGIPGFGAVLARALCDAGREADAAAVLTRSASGGFADLPLDVTWLSVVCIFADTATRVRDVGAARRLRELLLPWADQIAYPGFGISGSVAYWLCELCLVLDDDRAPAFHAQGLAHHRSLGAPVWLARSESQESRLATGGAGPDAALDD